MPTRSMVTAYMMVVAMHFHIQENEYVFAIKSVGSVLAPYDTDQMIPSFGFGARLPPNDQVSHCFPLNFNYHNPEVNGVQVSIEK